MPEPKEISCEIFRAVFDTQVSEQGATNLAYHLGICSGCATFAQSKYVDARVPVISCDRYWEIDALESKKSPSEEASYWKHYKKCGDCKARSWQQAAELVAHIFREELSSS